MLRWEGFAEMEGFNSSKQLLTYDGYRYYVRSKLQLYVVDNYCWLVCIVQILSDARLCER